MSDSLTFHFGEIMLLPLEAFATKAFRASKPKILRTTSKLCLWITRDNMKKYYLVLSLILRLPIFHHILSLQMLCRSSKKPLLSYSMGDVLRSMDLLSTGLFFALNFLLNKFLDQQQFCVEHHASE